MDFFDGPAFRVLLYRRGLTLEVPEGKTLLGVVRGVVPDAPSSCGFGNCGTCATGVIAGIPDHRDAVLTRAERARNDEMMICVGRSFTPLLVLDL